MTIIKEIEKAIAERIGTDAGVAVEITLINDHLMSVFSSSEASLIAADAIISQVGTVTEKARFDSDEEPEFCWFYAV